VRGAVVPTDAENQAQPYSSAHIASFGFWDVKP
jgi:hypothetical protein